VEDGDLADLDTSKLGWLVAFYGSFYRVAEKQRSLKGSKGGMVCNPLEKYCLQFHRVFMGLAKLELPRASGKSDRTVPNPAYVHHRNTPIVGEVYIPMGGMCAICMLVPAVTTRSCLSAGML